MKPLLVVQTALGLGIALGTGVAGTAQKDAPRGAPAAEKIGWRLGVQAYSFNRFTFYEAIEKTASLGLHYIEAYPGQALSKDHPGVAMDHNLPPELRAEVKRKLKAAHLKLVNYGVVGLGTDEAANRKVFDFARDMGIETIVSEPPPEAFDLLDKLCQEYKINVALHNHPQPSRYWNPEAVLEACQGHSQRIGACCDTGHWIRSGVDPLEALKKLQGRIITFHFKDLNERAPGAHDVPWGTGVGEVRELLAELYRQRVKAVFSIEYEHNWDNSLPDMAQCVEYFNRVAEELSRTSKKNSASLRRVD